MYDPLRAKSKVALYGGVTFIVGLGIASGLGWTQTSLAIPIIDEEPALSIQSVKPAADLSEAFVNIADVVTPAVVRIQSRRPARETAARGANPAALLWAREKAGWPAPTGLLRGQRFHHV